MPGWRWDDRVDYHEIGTIVLQLPNKDNMIIRARVEDCDGDMGYYSVWENDVLVATGQISSADQLWRCGDGPKLEAERVICYGADSADKAILKQYLDKFPDAVKRIPNPKEKLRVSSIGKVQR